MKLDTYLSAKALSDTEFAVLIGYDRSSVNRWRHGKYKPDLSALQKIVDATEGAVTPNDFFAAPETGMFTEGREAAE